jgi:flagellar M-ring protein FliF
MPTVDRISPAAVWHRLRMHGNRLQRSVMAQRPAIRWGVAIAACAFAVGLMTVSYWALSSLSTLEARHLLSGKHFSSEDLIKICRALDRQRVAYRVDEERRVQVGSDQFDQAAELVGKLDLGQHSIDEIREGSSSWGGFLDPPNERERKKHLDREKILERLIKKLDGVGWSLVSINRPQTSGRFRPVGKTSAFVYLETEGNRHLPSQTIQAIPLIVARFETDLTPASITVMDRWGKIYFDAGNLTVGDQARDRAREEELAGEIKYALNWIKGVRVQVQVATPRSGEPGSAVASPSAIPAGRQPPSPQTGSGPERTKAIISPSVTLKPMIGVNQPLTLDPNSEAESPAKASLKIGADSGITVNETTASVAAAGPVSVAQADQRSERGRLLIYVPRSFYYYADIRNPEREPTRDELLAMRERTERQIRKQVGLVIPESGSWKVDIDTIPDDVAPGPLAVLPSADDPRRKVLDWGIVSTVGAAVSIMVAFGAWIHVARRPAGSPAPLLKSRPYHVDSASARGPSERVRELIRRNPKAAASVLQRWAEETGQGS